MTEHNEDGSNIPIFGDLTGAGKVVNSEVARRAYDDALSGPFRELGGLSTDLLKSLRLFTAPFQMVAAYQDRLANFCERVRSKVPEDHQRDAAPEIAAPVMQAIAVTSEQSPLMSMFEELMARTIDAREAGNLSPEFPQIIQSLSPMEAKLIKSITNEKQILDNMLDGGTIVRNLAINFNVEDFGGFAHHLTLVQALIAKKLVSDDRKRIENLKEQYPDLVVPENLNVQRTTVSLSMFGRWFSSACISKPVQSSKPR